MTTLILFAHADPTATPPVYHPALVGLDVELRCFVSHYAGLSSSYVTLAQHLQAGHGGGRLLPAIASLAGASKPFDQYERVVLVSWSAGYALARAVLEVPADVEDLDGYVCLDSGYGSPTPAWVAFAKLAREGKKLLWAGCTDIKTEPAYPSSSAFLEELEHEAGLAGDPKGLFRIERWGGADAAAHVAALRVHGPVFLRAALEALGLEEPIATASGPDEPLGQRALEVAVAELGVEEVPPGSNTGPRVTAYLEGCERGGKPLGLRAGNWCAAFVGWCDAQAAQDGEQAPPWRASVAELWADAKAGGRAHDASWAPATGDLAIFGRDGQDPRRGGPGHVGRVESFGDGSLVTIEGNSQNAVRRVARRLGELVNGAEPLVGWISRS
jgi:hypothetical protein